MKKSLLSLLFLVLLLVSFRGGTWYNQRWTGGTGNSGGDRPILHYVDPMNPENVSAQPGIAPCGMPMEPVYGEGGAGTQAADGTLPPGTVKITPQKQQLIGVRIGTAEMMPETHGIRTLGRIAADENRIYPLSSAVDGWMSYLSGSTTGSLVQKDQLMALVRIYSYDFFSWQQRYLTELANAGRRRLPATNFTGARQQQGDSLRTAAQPEPVPSAPGMELVSSQDEPPQPEASQPETTPHAGKTPVAKQGITDHSMHEAREARSGNLDPAFMREDDILYANKAKMELLNLGVREIQLDALAQTGKYVTTVEIRSPVTGLLTERSVSPLQKVERGTECFRVADLSRVWILADVFNTDAQYIQPGMSAKISLPRQSKYLEARVSDVLPEFDAATRTLKVRLEMKNPNNEFRPDMFVDVELLVTMPPAITVPADAVLDSGNREIVFVALGDGYFEPREVVTGWRFDGRVEIVKGLAPGERFVISGNFLIDSESRIKRAAAGRMAQPETKNGSAGKEQ